MNKKIIEILPWFILISLVILDIIMYIGIIKMFFGFGMDIIVGLFGLVGAILTGVVTLIGVRMGMKSSSENLKLSLEFQEKADFINSAPLKIRSVHSAIKKLNELANMVLVTKQKTDKDLIDIQTLVEEILDETSKVNGIVFSYIEPIDTEINLVFVPEYKKLRTRDKEGFFKLDLEKATELEKETYKTIEETIEILRTEKLKLQSDYRKAIYNIS
ncbi:hypothetical protein [Ornithinibacillus bavariensis]|uniref:hypothetical protein n=1 Tax=Ornithinibacillus bavariensis TaxID=545502 RepID=UPI000ED69C00|nr:hypothetical protein [Ornithinibacillus sp.]